MTKKRKRYTDEFKLDAIRLVLEEGLSKAEASRRLGVVKCTPKLGQFGKENKV